MSVITFPAALTVASMTWAQHRNDIKSRSIFGSQAVEASSPLWAVSITSGKMREDTSGAWKALMLKLKGSANQLAVWDIARPEPLGTMRGAMALTVAAAAGATSLTISAGPDYANATLLTGDWLGSGSGLTQQVIMVTADAAADSETRSLSLDFTTETYGMGYPGEITVSIEPPLRNALAVAAAITWDQPKALFRVQDDRLGWDYESVFASGFGLNLLEDWRA